jgi:acetyltransferase-like isoleucine patch superfamily enzyme
VAKRYGWPALFKGLWLKRTFHGRYVVCEGGWPLPKVVNRGGVLQSGGCSLWNGTRLEIGRGAHLSIGRGTYINRNSLIICRDRVTIGRNCRISWDVIIMDSDEHPHPAIKNPSAPIEIQDGAWIGCRTIILKGVTVGAGSIVGAGSVVTHDVPPFTVVVGQPAKVIRYLHTSGGYESSSALAGGS